VTSFGLAAVLDVSFTKANEKRSSGREFASDRPMAVARKFSWLPIKRLAIHSNSKHRSSPL